MIPTSEDVIAQVRTQMLAIMQSSAAETGQKLHAASILMKIETHLAHVAEAAVKLSRTASG